MSFIRTSTKAIIVNEGNLLAIQHYDAEGVWYSLPGGGQNHGEALTDALKRECVEELGVQVEVGRLRFVRDYIGANHEFSDEHPHIHQVEFLFECRLLGDPASATPSNPDSRQVGVAWLPLAELASFRLYPKLLQKILQKDDGNDPLVYLGDIN